MIDADGGGIGKHERHQESYDVGARVQNVTYSNEK